MTRPLKIRASHLTAAALAVLFLWGCARLPVPTASSWAGKGGELGGCADLIEALDRRTSADGAMDAGAFRVPGHPYLRVDRFLASFRSETVDTAAFNAWVDRMQALDLACRRYEIANLPEAGVVAVNGDPDRLRLFQRVSACGDQMKAADLRNTPRQEKLRTSVAAPPDYIPLRRALGLYPLTRFWVLRGVARWHGQARRTFSTSPPEGEGYIQYAPEMSAPPATTGSTAAEAPKDALGIPRFTLEQQQALFRDHAPVWQVRTGGVYDRPGTPFWAADGSPALDTAAPVVYTRMSFARFGGQVLTQLNYVIWFSARPKDHPLDLYGGVLDGVNLRVTLDGNGKPLLWETIHNCGCYYKAYPTERLEARRAMAYPEPPLILRAPVFHFPGDRAAVVLDSRTHYVTHLYAIPVPVVRSDKRYTLLEYDRLRSLSHPRGGRASLFDATGITRASRRLERFIFWPTGVLSPGAMRLWGRHAVAFVGERHFDDPHALENMFLWIASASDLSVHLSNRNDTPEKGTAPDPVTFQARDKETVP